MIHTKPNAQRMINRSLPEARGLMAAWFFNEGGGLLGRELARRKDVTLNGPTWIPQGLSFDGINDSLSVPSVVFGSNWTYYIILRRPVLAVPPGYQTIGTANAAHGFYYRRPGAPNNDKIVYYDGTDRFSNTPLVAGEWRHFACSVRNLAATFYSNGIADGTATFGAGFTMTHVGNNTSTEIFTGEIAAILAWDRPLTAAEIMRLYADPYRLIREPLLLDVEGAAAGGPAEQDISGGGCASTAATGAGTVNLRAAAGGCAATAAGGAGSLQLRCNGTGAQPTAVGGVGAAKEQIAGGGRASTAVGGVGSAQENISNGGRASTAVGGGGSVVPSGAISGGGCASTASTGVGTVRLRLVGVGRASTATGGGGSVGDDVYEASAQELEIWIGEAGDTVVEMVSGDLRVVNAGETAVEMSDGETVAESEAFS